MTYFLKVVGMNDRTSLIPMENIALFDRPNAAQRRETPSMGVVIILKNPPVSCPSKTDLDAILDELLLHDWGKAVIVPGASNRLNLDVLKLPAPPDPEET